MRILVVMCVIGIAGMALAKPSVRMSRGFRDVKSGTGLKRPLNPLHMVRNQLSKSMKSASHRKKIVCELCPPPSDMEPCSCECECKTTKCLANIKCGSDLQTASELQRVLSLSSYPVRNYSSLQVEHTFVDGPISKYLLGSTVSFEEINFNDNGFKGVDPNAFEDTGDTVKRLILSNNEIIYMKWTMEDLPNIQHLDMSHNRITYIPSCNMNCMQSNNLRYLNISHNNVPDIGDSAFKGLTKLTYLDLSNNTISKLSSNMLAFENHEDVFLWVNLSYNRIASVASNAISGIRKIIVDLRYNNLGTLKEDIFKNFIDSTDASIHFDVTGNPIVCDCYLLWVVQNSTVANCFDDFPVCDSTIRNVTTANLGDCGQNETTATLPK